MAKIKKLTAQEILDSRGMPTVEATLLLDDTSQVRASCPNGKSKSSYEAVFLTDKDTKRFAGNGVLKAVEHIEKVIAPQIIGKDPTAQQEIDNLMIAADGTENKANLGANALLPVSLCLAKAAAKSLHLPLYSYLHEYIKDAGNMVKIPTPAFNVLNGGVHAGRNVDFQEFLVIPATAKTYSESLQAGFSVYNGLKNVLIQENFSTLVGDEGGFAPIAPTNGEGFMMVKHAIEQTKYQLGLDVFLGVDIAATEFYSEHKYHLKDKNTPLSSKDLIAYYESLNKIFRFLYMEDPLSEDDWDAWSEITQHGMENTIIVGDDLIATNPYRLQTAIDKNAITGVIIKPNQIGTVIEALAVVAMAKAAGLKVIVSHRSGETNDDFIADFAVGVGADYVKFGAPARGERVAKYNRLLAIEKDIMTK